MSDNRKSLLIALGAGAALIGAALLYHFISQSDSNGDEVDVEEVIDQLRAEKLD
jgi:isopentenyl diphosphate isomerase/L-lactate dehydrogenase-like FMN-dependent dehydrogenase